MNGVDVGLICLYLDAEGLVEKATTDSFYKVNAWFEVRTVLSDAVHVEGASMVALIE